MAFKFWSVLFSFVLGLLGVGQLHDYIVSGKAPANFKDAPRMLRAIIESHDITNAKRLVEAASYSDAAGQYAVIPGDVKKTIDRLTGHVERDRFDESQIEVTLAGLTESECLRAARFLTFKGDILVLRDDPTGVTTREEAPAGKLSAQQRNRVAVSRPLGTNAGFGI